MSYQIAIDGPAGAGKSTIAKKVARLKEFIYVDTGAMYRAMAYYLFSKQVDPKDEEAVSRECRGAHITIQYVGGEQVVLLNGENVNPYLRTEEVGNMASLTSKNPKVRERLTQLQKELARQNDVVMDGRDIGTCVLPDTGIIFLFLQRQMRWQGCGNCARLGWVCCLISPAGKRACR